MPNKWQNYIEYYLHFFPGAAASALDLNQVIETCILAVLLIIPDSLAELQRTRPHSAARFAYLHGSWCKDSPVSLHISIRVEPDKSDSSPNLRMCSSASSIHSQERHGSLSHTNPPPSTRKYFPDNTCVLRIAQFWQFQRKAVGVEWGGR